MPAYMLHMLQICYMAHRMLKAIHLQASAPLSHMDCIFQRAAAAHVPLEACEWKVVTNTGHCYNPMQCACACPAAVCARVQRSMSEPGPEEGAARSSIIDE